MTRNSENQVLSTGVAGLDDVLEGGLIPRRLYLVEGTPGSGKTTLALQFLLAGVAAGERVMYVTLSESAEELRATASAHGWTLDGIDIVQLAPNELGLTGESQYTMYHPSEVELAETTKIVLRRVDETKPTRMVFDSLSELRLLAQNSLRFRRQVLALKQHFSSLNCTVLLADDRSADAGDADLFSIAHGVISLERRATDYGSLRRQLHVAKYRGRKFREGWHDLRITTGGLRVYPRLVSAEHHAEFDADEIRSDIVELDLLMGGGLTRGTSTLVMGPAGAGKSAIASQYALAGCERGEKAAIFLFEELLATFFKRSGGLGMQLAPHVDNGTLQVRQIDPAEMSPGEFAQIVRDAVEIDGVAIVVIDTLNGYLNSMPSEKLLMIHLHELLSYLGQRGVTTLLVTAQHGLVGSAMGTPIDTSYLADNVILLRYFESRGELCQAISVVKKRTGPHERTIRELHLSSDGVKIGEPLRGFRGVLSGIPAPEASAGDARRDAVGS
jgi:circadian clock protein KaiC